MTNIHPTAVVSAKAKIGNNVNIGPYCFVGDHVTLHDNITLKANVYIEGVTEIGEGGVIYPFTTIGTAAQDRKDTGEPASVIIGKNAIIRENTTVTAGSLGGGGLTRLGDNVFIMSTVHVGHDCMIGDNVMVCSGTGLGGHIHIDDNAYIGGHVAIHQFARIGRNAMLGGKAGIQKDVIPYGLVGDYTQCVKGINVIGLKRMGLQRSEILGLTKAFRMLFNREQGTLHDRISQTAEVYKDHPRVMEIIAFLQEPSKMGVGTPE